MLQGTPEWRQARCGSLGGSDMPRVVRKLKSGGYSSDREQLMAEKFVERTTGVPYERFKNSAMIQGTEREPIARMTYELLRGVEVEEVGLIPHPTIKHTHASPDGFVGATGLIEIKAPLPAAHLETLKTEAISQDHYVQMQWQMACCPERAWCDFVSFSSDFAPTMQIYVKRVRRDDAFIRELEREAIRFIKDLEQEIDRLTRRYERVAA